ncbi:hypothetical protein F5148DRAFT_415448 [Russula earlei]|uniref:Uncharacterized protein n=1 Tax=Russula earlei TaxID=71964 RepID=A0ACC0U166_9AGAM|nr:hypothetical protein F5148DRAFT_415448 [Russula earlei]
MNYDDQDPRYRSGHYPTPFSNSSQQPEHPILFSPNTQRPYSSRPGYNAYSSYPGGPQPFQPSGTSGSYPPYGEGHVSYSQQHIEPSLSQRSHPGYPATYLPSQTSNSFTDPHHYARRDTLGDSSGSYDMYPAGSYDMYPAGSTSSVTGRTDSYPGFQSSSWPGGYTAMDARSQDRDTAGHNEAHGNYHQLQRRGPPSYPSVGQIHKCRYPSCQNRVSFDSQVNDYAEWCSVDHMEAAVRQGLQKPCKQCRVWPRRMGYQFCGGTACIYPSGS